MNIFILIASLVCSILSGVALYWIFVQSMSLDRVLSASAGTATACILFFLGAITLALQCQTSDDRALVLVFDIALQVIGVIAFIFMFVTWPDRGNNPD